MRSVHRMLRASSFLANIRPDLALLFRTSFRLIRRNEGPVSMAERFKACTVYDRSNIGIAGSNLASGMDVCPRVSVLCCPVSVEALHQADPPSKESYQNISICRSRSPLG
jgi:hypothetical protein